MGGAAGVAGEGLGLGGRAGPVSVTSLTSADATAQDLARLVREHWSSRRTIMSAT